MSNLMNKKPQFKTHYICLNTSNNHTCTIILFGVWHTHKENVVEQRIQQSLDIMRRYGK